MSPFTFEALFLRGLLALGGRAGYELIDRLGDAVFLVGSGHRPFCPHCPRRVSHHHRVCGKREHSVIGMVVPDGHDMTGIYF